MLDVEDRYRANGYGLFFFISLTRVFIRSGTVLVAPPQRRLEEIVGIEAAATIIIVLGGVFFGNLPR